MSLGMDQAKMSLGLAHAQMEARRISVSLGTRPMAQAQMGPGLNLALAKSGRGPNLRPSASPIAGLLLALLLDYALASAAFASSSSSTLFCSSLSRSRRFALRPSSLAVPVRVNT